MDKKVPGTFNAGLHNSLEKHRQMQNFQDEIFENQWRKIIRQQIKGTVKRNFVKEMFFDVMNDSMKKLQYFGIDPNEFDINYDTLEHGRIIEQIYYYHQFYTSHLSDEERAKKQKNAEYRSELVGMVSGNVLVENLHDVKFASVATKNSPEIIAYKIFANRMLATVVSAQGKNNVIVDSLIQKTMGAIKGIVALLADGLGSSAVALWRQLYEQECTLIAILRGGQPAVQAYFDHQKYYDLEWEDNDTLEAELRQKLAEYKLDRSEREMTRNRRSYINYGWLLEIDEFKNGLHRPYRLDFKNGLQAFAGQSCRYETYAEASKITHSSGMMIAATAETYYFFIMLRLYETVHNLTPWLGEYFAVQGYVDQGKDMDEFKDSVSRDLEQITRNYHTILEKYPVTNE